MTEITRRTLITSTFAAMAAPTLWTPESAQATELMDWAFRKTYTIGRSVQNRAIKVRRLGYPYRPVKMVIVGCIHGNEDDGRWILNRLWHWTPPSNTCVFLISTMNPDGNAASSGNALSLKGRLNARGVNLNRNFPGSIRTGERGQQTYSGPRSDSEPETRAVHKFLVDMDPHLLVVYHQHMNLVDYCGGNKDVQRAYARTTKQKFTQLTRYRGSMATYWHRRRPKATVMTVELAAKTPAYLVSRHERALKALIRADAAHVAGSAD